MSRFRGNGVIIAALVVMSFLQRPGETSFDTKFDLSADPARFLSRTLHLWNPAVNFGELQNQAYGYLFPQGSFFLLGQVAGVPDWVVQRLWSALLLVLAYEGTRRLWRSLSPASSWGTQVLAGLGYVLAPRMLGLVGVLSAEILPTVVLPWVVLPLVAGLRGTLTPRTAGLASGAAVLFMGGVNAVEDLAALPLPALFLLCSLRQPIGRRLTAWWVVATTLASLWWMLPLLVLGKYSPPFLDYIETATATTRPLGWTNVVRGADHWLAYVNVGGRPWWPAAQALAVEPVLIALTALVASIGLLGLAHPRMPARAPLLLSLALGMVCLTLAHHTTWGSPLSAPVRELLDTTLAPLRNVHKVDPLVRLPMALGLAHVAGVVALRLRERTRRVRVPRWAVAGALGLVVVAAAQPALAGELRKPGWDELPGAWAQASRYLEQHASETRALVLPGSGFGQQTWGWTIDEPIQGSTSSPWVSRSQVPLVPGTTIRLLDSLEERVDDGEGSPAFADTLARSGIGYVVVRRDLDLAASSAPSPDRVDQAIARSPGLTRVETFGRTAIGDPLVEIYRVQRSVPRIEAVTTTSLATVDGGPEDVISLQEAGVLDADRPAIIRSDAERAGVAATAQDLVADGYRRRERQFGQLVDSASQMMTADEPWRNERRAHDYAGVEGAAQATTVYRGLSGVTASTSMAYADSWGAVHPEMGPAAAVDGKLETYWRSAPLHRPDGQWLELRLSKPTPLDWVDVVAAVDGLTAVPVRRISVAAGEQVVPATVDPASGQARVRLNGAAVDRVRITVTAAQGDPASGTVALREVGLPGLTIDRTLAVPARIAGDAGVSFRARPPRRACVTGQLGRVCEPYAMRTSEEEGGLDRTFTTSDAGRWMFLGRIVARSTPGAAALLEPVGGQVAATASSVLDGDPAVSGQFAVDGDPATPWLSGRGDPSPQLSIRWKGKRTIDRVQIVPSAGAGRAPTRAVIEAGGRRREVDLRRSLGFIEPLRTDHLDITFPMPDGPAGENPSPVAVGDIRIDGLEDLTYAPADVHVTGALCGLGPTLTVDGTSVPTKVVGTLGDVRTGTPLRLKPCGGTRGILPLSAGRHRVVLASDDRFMPSSLTLKPVDNTPPPVVTRSATIDRWEATQRVVRVGAGDSAVLRVPENVNAGWRATLDGRPLTATRIDGWQQAWLVPAGAGGVVTMTYSPDRIYRAALGLGGIAGVVLVVGLGASVLRDRRRPAAAALGEAALPGPDQLLPATAWSWCALAVAAVLAGGAPLLLGVLLGGVLGRRYPRAWCVGPAVTAVAGVVAACTTGVDSTLLDQGSDLLAAGGVGMVMATLVRLAPRRVEGL